MGDKQQFLTKTVMCFVLGMAIGVLVLDTVREWKQYRAPVCAPSVVLAQVMQ